jgi:DNA-directed RNA polymerase subunit RPC12/RpoP
MTDSEGFTTYTCENCGRELRHDARFCPYCGYVITKPKVTGPLPPEQLAEKVTGPLEPDQLAEKITGPLEPDQLLDKTTGPLQPTQLEEKITGPLEQAITADITTAAPRVTRPLPPPSRAYRLRHAVLISLLVIGIAAFLAGALMLDRQSRDAPRIPAMHWTPVAVISTPPAIALPEQRQVRIEISDSGMFGLATTNGRLATDIQNKRLIFDPQSGSGNLLISVDGVTDVLGKRDLAQYVKALKAEAPITWQWQQDSTVITQTLDIVLGSDDGDGGPQGNLLRVAYQINNQDTQSHQVGLRLLLDTRIGDNDGVPFLIPGQPGITDQAVDLTGEQVPTVIQALEKDNLSSPGVITSLVLRGADVQTPDRVVISGWPGPSQEWDYLDAAGGLGAPLRKAGQVDGEPDSAVGLYYDPQTLSPGEIREIVFYYGLGDLSSRASGNPEIGLFAPRKVLEGEVFYLSAVVATPDNSDLDGVTVRLDLPEELRLLDGEDAEKSVEGVGEPYTQVSWLVQACRPGKSVTLTVYLEPQGVSETWTLTVEPVGITRPGGVCP